MRIQAKFREQWKLTEIGYSGRMTRSRTRAQQKEADRCVDVEERNFAEIGKLTCVTEEEVSVPEKIKVPKQISQTTSELESESDVPSKYPNIADMNILSDISDIPARYSGPGDVYGEIMEIENLVDVSTSSKRARRFLVKWMGYPAYKSTWEREENLPKNMVKAFFMDQADRKWKGIGPGNNALENDARDSEGVHPSFASLIPAAKSTQQKKEESFPKDWIPKRVLGMEEGTQMKRMIVEFKNGATLSASYEYCKSRIPQLVIELFQASLQ